MFFIPGIVIAVLTFPGIIVHEAAHFLFCRITGLAVLDVCYFRMGDPSGYVVHEGTESFGKTFLVGMGPFFVNSVLCIAFCLGSVIPVWELEVVNPVAWFFMWLGLSIGMHAFPSSHDLASIWNMALPAARRGNVLAIVSYPLIGILYVAGFLRVVWADLGYGLLIGILLPLAMFRLFA